MSPAAALEKKQPGNGRFLIFKNSLRKFNQSSQKLTFLLADTFMSAYIHFLLAGRQLGWVNPFGAGDSVAV